MKFKIIMVLLLLFLLINFYNNNINSLEVILKIDFNSLVDYDNFECGGPLPTKRKDGTFYLKDISYPPCKSFGDAGNRSRSFYRVGNFRTYENLSLIFLIENSNEIDWNNYIIKPDRGIWKITYFCYFEIRVENHPNAILTIDGSEINGNFIIYDAYSNGLITCDSNQSTTTKISNLKLLNFNTTFMKIEKSNAVPAGTIDNSKITKIIEISSIKTQQVSSLFYTESIYGISPIHLIIKDSIFDGKNQIINDTLISLMEGFLEINNCYFQNIISIYFNIIVSSYGEHFIANNIHFNNIILKNQNSFFHLVNIQSNIDNLTIENSKFLNFMSLYCSINYNVLDINKCGEAHFFNNILFKNNQINLNPIPYVKLFHFESTPVYLENITIESNNQIELYKKLFFFNFVTYVSFKNIKIPNNSQFSASIVSNNTKIDLDNYSYSLLHSKQFCIGSSNDIMIKVLNNNNTERIKNKISELIKDENSCIGCNLHFSLIQDRDNYIIPNTSDSSVNNNNTNSSSTDSKHTSSLETIKSQFNKILLIPILLSLCLLLLIILILFFRNKIKEKIIIIKNKNKINNTNFSDAQSGNIGQENIVEMDIYGSSEAEIENS